MPTISDPNTVRAIAREYVTNGRNKAQALITVGYKPSYANSGKGTILYAKKAVIDEISKFEQDIRLNTDWTVDRAQAMLLETRDRAIKQGTSSVEVSAVVAINRMFGLDRDNDVSDTKTEEIDANQKIEAHRLAQIRLTS
jgi:hypothetical protein